MARVDMVMPQMGESIAEATILKWLKNIGDSVKKDETILEISTDKVDSEIPAPATGTIVEFKANVGDTVPVKSVIAIIETDAQAAKDAPKAAPKAAAAPAPKKVEEKKEAPAKTPEPPKHNPAPPRAEAQPAMELSGVSASGLPTHYGEKFFSPLVRNISAQYGISAVELAAIPGSGEHGRVTKADVMNYIQHRTTGAVVSQTNGHASAARESRGGKDSPSPAPRPEYGPDGTRVEQMDNMRKRIAEHMVRSKATSAHVYSTAEIDVYRIARWREKQQATFLAREGFKLSFTPFFLEAAVKALIAFPLINSSVDGDKIILKKDINLGCAVALGNTGLIVPVIRNADQLSLVGLARALNDLATRARTKALKPDEVQGGTFTVTNPGVFGNIIGNPIINQPQVAILSTGAIKKRPVVVDDMIAVREIVYLTLSYDHRIIDGSLGGQYLQHITKYLESWDMNRELY